MIIKLLHEVQRYATILLLTWFYFIYGISDLPLYIMKVLISFEDTAGNAILTLTVTGRHCHRG